MTRQQAGEPGVARDRAQDTCHARGRLAHTHLSMFLIWLCRARKDTGESMASRLLAQSRTTFSPVWWIFSVSWSTAMLLGAQTSTGLQHKVNKCLRAQPEEIQEMLTAKTVFQTPRQWSPPTCDLRLKPGVNKAEEAKNPTGLELPAPTWLTRFSCAATLLTESCISTPVGTVKTLEAL